MKIHAHAEGQGHHPLGFILTGGEASNYSAIPGLLVLLVGQPHQMLANKGYDVDTIHDELLLHGTCRVE